MNTKKQIEELAWRCANYKTWDTDLRYALQIARRLLRERDDALDKLEILRQLVEAAEI